MSIFTKTGELKKVVKGINLVSDISHNISFVATKNLSKIKSLCVTEDGSYYAINDKWVGREEFKKFGIIEADGTAESGWNVTLKYWIEPLTTDERYKIVRASKNKRIKVWVD